MGAVASVAAPVGRRVGTLAALSYPVLIAGVAVARHAGAGVRVRDLASSPAAVASGEVWRLVTSAFVIAGPPIPQVLQMSVVVAAALVLGGPALFWRAAFVGHVVATLAAYAG